MALEHVFLINLSALAGSLLLLWVVSLLRRDVSIIDIFWGCGFVLVTWISLATADRLQPGSGLLALMVTLWGLRLAGYLAWRKSGKPEDYRYVAMRRQHGKRFPLVSLVTVFGLQGILIWIISLPIQVGISSAPGWPWAASLGVTLWSIGLFFESVGDYQLARFKADPANRGRVLDRGLWRYTRHPNYFGDFLVWWGIYLVAMQPSSWWWTVVGPLLMSVLLIRVSGVKLLESSLQTRVTGYDQYIRNTSAFFPRPPKRDSPAD